MIKAVFGTIAEELNQYFGNRFALNEEKVIVSALPDSGGNANNPTNEDNLIVSLVNIEQERLSNSRSGAENKPVNLYLYALFAAGFTDNNYEESLKLLSATISFFQGNPVLHHQNTSGLPSEIDKLCFEMINMNVQELSQLWGIQGGRYYPSVLYRIRVVSIREEGIINDGARLVGFGDKMTKL